MNDIKRWYPDPDGDMYEVEDGEYVRSADYDSLRATLKWVLDNKIALSEGEFYQRDGRIDVGYGGWYECPPIPLDLAPNLNEFRGTADKRSNFSGCTITNTPGIGIIVEATVQPTVGRSYLLTCAKCGAQAAIHGDLPAGVQVNIQGLICKCGHYTRNGDSVRPSDQTGEPHGNP